MKNLAFNPLAKKRLRRFIRHRRAFASFLLLVCIYIITLCAELICNGRPLAVICNKRIYFPFIAYYSEDSFLKNGITTAPDYRKLKGNAAAVGMRCSMLWAPCRYSPNDIIGEEELLPHLRMHCSLEPVISTAVFTVDKDLKVKKAQNADAILKDASSLDDFSGIWHLPQDVLDAIAMRFSNQAAPSFKIGVANHVPQPPNHCE